LGAQVHDQALLPVGAADEVQALGAQLHLLRAKAPQAAHGHDDRLGPPLGVGDDPRDLPSPSSDRSSAISAAFQRGTGSSEPQSVVPTSAAAPSTLDEAEPDCMEASPPTKDIAATPRTARGKDRKVHS
jgi:hypothetical protein